MSLFSSLYFSNLDATVLSTTLHTAKYELFVLFILPIAFCFEFLSTQIFMRLLITTGLSERLF